MATETVLRRQQREGTVFSGSIARFWNGSSTDRVRVVADMDAAELASDKKLTLSCQFRSEESGEFETIEWVEWNGPADEPPSIECRVPAVQETSVRVAIDTHTHRINVGATITALGANQ